MTANFRMRLIGAVLLSIVPALLCGCHGGANQPSVIYPRPAVTDLSTHTAAVGHSLAVLGTDFGASQGSSAVRLNGVNFSVAAWSDTQIDVTVAAGMESGYVVVTVRGLSSVSGPAAYLVISETPGAVHIADVTPAFGTAGDEIQLTGSNFGAAADGHVYFPARDGAVSQDGGVVAAEIATAEVDGTPVPQWSETSIRLIVPDAAEYGEVLIYVDSDGQRSNAIMFVVNPPPGGQPAIHDVVPPSGEIGMEVTIGGERFGIAQGATILLLGDLPMDVSAWADGEITARVPAGAVTADIIVSKPGYDPAVWPHFVVGNAPEITSATPSIINNGVPFRINGHGFGSTQGSGQLTIGGVEQDVSSWSDTKVEVDSLDLPPNVGELPVIVTNDSGLPSNEYAVYFWPDFSAEVSVSPLMGQRDGDGADELGTIFTFEATVSGGSGAYNFYLIPDADNPALEAPVSTTGTIEYTYPYDATVLVQEYVETKMRVEDAVHQVSLTVDGPTLLLVWYGVPVVGDIALPDFNRGAGIIAPNDLCYSPVDGSYHDFSFVGGEPLFTSSQGDILVGGNPAPSYTRDLASFMEGGANQRPYGYRYFGLPGSTVTVFGLNFGDIQGQLYLNTESIDFKVAVSDFDAWTDTAITFKLPAVLNGLSGVVGVVPAGSAFEAKSSEPLICSPYVVQLLPDSVSYPGGTLVLSGFDFSPPQLDGITGGGTYAIYFIRAEYVDPWTSVNTTAPVLLTTPIATAELVSTTMTFNMSDIDIDSDGTVPVEVFSFSGDESTVVEAKPVAGQWFFFLWTGVLDEGTNQEIANSGIFSEMYAVEVSSGLPGDDPVARLEAHPTSGVAPLQVDFDASGSTDNGTIVKYEFDFGEGAGYEDYGTTDTAQHTYSSGGAFAAQLRVTDDDGNTDELNVPLAIAVGEPEVYPLEVGLTINFGPYIQTDILSRIRLYYHEPTGVADVEFFGQQFSDYPVDGVEQILTFNDVPAGQIWVSAFRIVTDWDNGDMDFGVYGPYTIPDTTIVHIVGDQYDEPPTPGG